jgi:rRNA maturation endonuclease Nob1
MKDVFWNFNRTPVSFCEWCGNQMDTGTGENKPRPGALSICLGCGHLAKYDDKLLVVELAPGERLKIEQSEQWPELSKYIAAVKQLAMERRARGEKLTGQR